MDWLTQNFSNLQRLIISKPARSQSLKKVVFRKIEMKKKCYYQETKIVGQQAFHRNIDREELESASLALIALGYRQILAETSDEQVHLIATLQGLKVVHQAPTVKRASEHNREKKRYFQEGVPSTLLMDLGIMGRDGKILSKMQGKFRQIHRFIEEMKPIIEQLKTTKKQITFIDIGCGKGYLTFALYDFLMHCGFEKVSGYGMDLKDHVIDTNRQIASKHQWHQLHFLCENALAFPIHQLPDGRCDLVIALHACDVATDAALQKGVEWGASAIVTAPCCHQRHLNQIQHPHLKEVMRYGVFKERLNAILTDALRATYLEKEGYDVVVAEFVDREDSLKNIMIKALKKKIALTNCDQAYQSLIDNFQFQPVFCESCHGSNSCH